MTEDDRLAHLVARLLELTLAGHVRWELAEDRDDAFTHATPSGAVVVFSRDRDGRDPYVLEGLLRDLSAGPSAPSASA